MSEALKALLNYQQADHDGIMVLASRQAIHEVADEIERLQKHHAEAQHKIGEYVDLTARLRAALERIASLGYADGEVPSGVRQIAREALKGE